MTQEGSEGPPLRTTCKFLQGIKSSSMRLFWVGKIVWKGKVKIFLSIYHSPYRNQATYLGIEFPNNLHAHHIASVTEKLAVIRIMSLSSMIVYLYSQIQPSPLFNFQDQKWFLC